MAIGGVLFDIDGVLVTSWRPIDGAAQTLQVLAFLEHFGIADDDPRVNPMGGAIAVGHPLASSGIRLMNYLARDFEDNPGVRYGLTSMCIGLGMGGTVIWENPNYTEGA